MSASATATIERRKKTVRTLLETVKSSQSSQEYSSNLHQLVSRGFLYPDNAAEVLKTAIRLRNLPQWLNESPEVCSDELTKFFNWLCSDSRVKDQVSTALQENHVEVAAILVCLCKTADKKWSQDLLVAAVGEKMNHETQQKLATVTELVDAFDTFSTKATNLQSLPAAQDLARKLKTLHQTATPAAAVVLATATTATTVNASTGVAPSPGPTAIASSSSSSPASVKTSTTTSNSIPQKNNMNNNNSATNQQQHKDPNAAIASAAPSTPTPSKAAPSSSKNNNNTTKAKQPVAASTSNPPPPKSSSSSSSKSIAAPKLPSSSTPQQNHQNRKDLPKLCSLFTSPHLLDGGQNRCEYDALCADLSSLRWTSSPSPQGGSGVDDGLLLSQDITDQNHPVFRFVSSKFRPTAATIMMEAKNKQKSLTDDDKQYKFPHTVTRIKMINSSNLVDLFSTTHKREKLAMQRNFVLKIASNASTTFRDDESRRSALEALNTFLEEDDVIHNFNSNNNKNPASSSPDPSSVESINQRARLVFCWHGTTAKRIDGICRDGFFSGIRSTDSGYFGAAGPYFAMEADAAARYSDSAPPEDANPATATATNNNGTTTPAGEHAVLLCLASISRTYPVTVKHDYREEEDPDSPHLWGFSRFFDGHDGRGIALEAKFDSHFIPVKHYGDRHPCGDFKVGEKICKKISDGMSGGGDSVDIDYQACDARDLNLAGHELVIAKDTSAIPIAVVYFTIQ